eukprot:CAMPEP_0178376128 /NCGR_PEP_ID=MMETSP0689_2-20121128/3243_1 /TAXON_ID=160604 /ORGANISM="Amphidinium massartii, Strain CS-259" /LENGTH=362 /DNA_ID=CAMNT_0019996141 /DNA_START=105 /DNA_END=1189 /DNA_ORIENTATION=-
MWNLRLALLAILSSASRATTSEDAWPNLVQKFTHEDSEGFLPGKQAVDHDFRQYYRVVALELLLMHHGYLPCEAKGFDQRDFDKTITAIEDFQRDRDLPVNAFSLDDSFWSSVAVPVTLGDENEAVLALQWLVEAVSEPTRPPTWDAVQVQSNDCVAFFDDALLQKLGASDALSGYQFQGFASPAMWRALLSAYEARSSHGCNYRAFVAHTFGVAWVVVWVAMGIAFTLLHVDGGWGFNTNLLVLAGIKPPPNTDQAATVYAPDAHLVGFCSLPQSCRCGHMVISTGFYFGDLDRMLLDSGSPGCCAASHSAWQVATLSDFPSRPGKRLSLCQHGLVLYFPSPTTGLPVEGFSPSDHDGLLR